MAGMSHRRRPVKEAAQPNRSAVEPELQPELEPDRSPADGPPLTGLAVPVRPSLRVGAVPVRPSLRVGAVDDPAELEAESIADLVVDALRRTPKEGLAEPVPDTAEPAQRGPVRRAGRIGAEGGAVDGSAATDIEQLLGGGQPLPDGIQRSMESAFGADLCGVRVHTGPTATRLNDQLGAEAFTAGNDIAFADGLPDVSRPDGQRLMAHELTHVLQHRGTDTLGALRRQAATVARHIAAPAPDRVELDTLSFSAAPETDDQAAEAIRRYFDIAVKPAKNDSGVYLIANIVISDRPPAPSKGGMAQHGGASFHHESAYTWLERQVTQFVGMPLAEAVGYLVKYGLDMWPRMPDPGASPMDQMEALNAYFHHFLETKAKQAEGWLGPTGTHSSQGGKISAAIKSLQSTGFTRENIFKALDVSFEPAPDVKDKQLWLAAQAHGDAFYAAYQQLLEKEGPSATIGLQQHEDILEIIKDWDTKYWKPEYDESNDVDMAEQRD
jgi:hypothetical protein